MGLLVALVADAVLVIVLAVRVHVGAPPPIQFDEPPPAVHRCDPACVLRTELAKLDELSLALDARMNRVVSAIADAQTEVERRDARDDLLMLRDAKADLQRRAAEVRAAAEKDHRNVVRARGECQGNPLAKGCP